MSAATRLWIAATAWSTLFAAWCAAAWWEPTARRRCPSRVMSPFALLLLLAANGHDGVPWQLQLKSLTPRPKLGTGELGGRTRGIGVASYCVCERPEATRPRSAAEEEVAVLPAHDRGALLDDAARVGAGFGVTPTGDVDVVRSALWFAALGATSRRSVVLVFVDDLERGPVWVVAAAPTKARATAHALERIEDMRALERRDPSSWIADTEP